MIQFKAGRFIFPSLASIEAQIKIADLLIDPEMLREFLIFNDFPILESDLIEQLSPDGLALIANSYNNKGDQCCDIYIAATAVELQDLILKMNASSNGSKVIVIFQPTDGAREFETMFHSLHKTVLYIEKKDAVLHIVHADSVDIDEFSMYPKILVEEILPANAVIFYTQQHILHPEDGSTLYLQAGFTLCGAHALRIARKMAKSSNFLDALEIVSSAPKEAGHFIEASYQLPVMFAVNADSSLIRRELLTMYAMHSERDMLVAHFGKYTEKYEYAGKFSQKYINMVQQILASTSQEDLKLQINNAKACNYAPNYERLSVRPSV
jgi:hypothetical protein